jgi:hypothetical protein
MREVSVPSLEQITVFEPEEILMALGGALVIGIAVGVLIALNQEPIVIYRRIPVPVPAGPNPITPSEDPNHAS